MGVLRLLIIVFSYKHGERHTHFAGASSFLQCLEMGEAGEKD